MTKDRRSLEITTDHLREDCRSVVSTVLRPYDSDLSVICGSCEWSVVFCQWSAVVSIDLWSSAAICGSLDVICGYLSVICGNLRYSGRPLLPVMRETFGEFFIFQQDSARAHRASETATACHAWDLWRVLYLPARQCSCTASKWEYQQLNQLKQLNGLSFSNKKFVIHWSITKVWFNYSWD